MTPGHYTCPNCRAQERSLSVWQELGSWHSKCHRASCGYYTRRPSMTQEAFIAPTLTPYRGDRYPPRSASIRRLWDRFGFVPREIQTVAYTTDVDREPFLIPILAPNGAERGLMEAVYGVHKRRRIWKAKDEPMISWTLPGLYDSVVWLVEDQISALKLHEVSGLRAVALLGTGLNMQVVAEIQKHAKHVTIALDADATAKAFILARQWGSAFKSCRVQILTKDIKDMSIKDIQDMTNNAGYTDSSSLFGGQASMGANPQAYKCIRSNSNGSLLVEGAQ